MNTSQRFRPGESPSLFRLVSLFAIATLIGCGPKAVDPEQPPKPEVQQEITQPEKTTMDKSQPIQPVDIGAASPAHVIGNVYLAGQPSAEDMATLKAKGIKTIVTLRPEKEIDWDEQAAVESAGMQFVSIPFKGEDQLTDEVFNKVRDVLNDKSEQPVLLHCGSSNRVGAVWMAHRMLDDGLGIDAALQEAKTAGLRSEGYEKKAADYVKREQAKK